jgi:hypothetical protein
LLRDVGFDLFLAGFYWRIRVAIVRLKLDIAGTRDDEAWRNLKQFDQAESTAFGARFGSSGPCRHPLDAPHVKGEWRGAEIRLPTSLLAQYAVSHYLEQDRVLDADIIEEPQHQ